MIRHILCHVNRILIRGSAILLIFGLITVFTTACGASSIQLSPSMEVSSPTSPLPAETRIPLTPTAIFPMENTPTPILLAPTSPLSTSTTSGESGVEGRVEIGPTCGNQPQQDTADCSNKPYETQLTVTDLNGQIVVHSKSDINGFFHIPLLPGEYILIPESTDFLSVSSISFSVDPNKFTYVPVLYHTDIQ